VKVFGFVLARKAEHSITIMCRVLEVSRSGYHAWAAREPSARAVADAALDMQIAEIHAGSLRDLRVPAGACRAAPGTRRSRRS
jgi:putative transposase